MARIRTIKPEFWVSRTITRLSYDARLTFIGLWNYCDDDGRGVDEPRLVKAAIWPLDDEMTPDVVERHLHELAKAGLIVRYLIGDASYLAVLSWKEHQRIDRPSPSKFPAPPAASPDSSIPRRAVVEPSSGERNRERNRERKDTPSTTDDGFDRFWNSYPARDGKKVDKAKARTIWTRLTNSKREQALRGVINYAAHCEGNDRFAKDAHRWLRDECWGDWQEPPVIATQNPGEEWAALVRELQVPLAGSSESLAAGGES